MRFIVILLCCLCSFSLAFAAHVEWVKVDGAIGPIAHKIIGEALDRAEASNAEALIIEMDTPGGLLSTTRLIAKLMLAAEIPVVVYISPSGGHRRRIARRRERFGWRDERESHERCRGLRAYFGRA